MTKHKWHKEIKAWADGAEIEMLETDVKNPEWIPFEGIWYDSIHVEYRIKPQLKEPQYLYVYNKGSINEPDYLFCDCKLDFFTARTMQYLGKLKLETDYENI